MCCVRGVACVCLACVGACVCVDKVLTEGCLYAVVNDGVQLKSTSGHGMMLCVSWKKAFCARWLSFVLHEVVKFTPEVVWRGPPALFL